MYEFQGSMPPSALRRPEAARSPLPASSPCAPHCIVLDRPTAMLDPMGRKEVMDTVKQLNRRAGVTVVLITHHMDEAAQADRLVSWPRPCGGRQHPKEVFADVEGLKAVGLTVPETVELCYELRQEGLALPLDALSDEGVCPGAISPSGEGRRIPHAERPKLSPLAGICIILF